MAPVLETLNTCMGNIVMSQPPKVGTNGHFMLREDPDRKREMEGAETKAAQLGTPYDPAESVLELVRSQEERDHQKERVQTLLAAHQREKNKHRAIVEENLAVGCMDTKTLRWIEGTRCF